jgi:hypothetical protein
MPGRRAASPEASTDTSRTAAEIMREASRAYLAQAGLTQQKMVMMLLK